MKIVQPIRDKEIIEGIKRTLKRQKKFGERNYMMFFIGINVGLRISDILPLKVGQVKNKDYLILTEKKTGKNKRHLLNATVQKELAAYTKDLPDDAFLFNSREGGSKPIDRSQAYRILNKAAAKFGLDEIGTHTLRKTFGYWHYKTFKDVALLQEIFNHSSPSITLKYIGINQDLIDESLKNFSL